MRRRTWNWEPLLLVAILAIVCGVAARMLMEQPEEPVARSSTSYGWLHQEEIAVTATGDDGAATGSADSDGPIRGHVYAVHLDYGSSVTTTTDITLSLSSPAVTVMALSDTATDGWYYPVVEQTGSTGSGTSTYDRLPLSGQMTVEVAESTAGTAVTATVWWGE